MSSRFHWSWLFVIAFVYCIDAGGIRTQNLSPLVLWWRHHFGKSVTISLSNIKIHLHGDSSSGFPHERLGSIPLGWNWVCDHCHVASLQLEEHVIYGQVTDKYNTGTYAIRAVNQIFSHKASCCCRTAGNYRWRTCCDGWQTVQCWYLPTPNWGNSTTWPAETNK